MIPCGSSETRGRVNKWARDNDINPMGHVNLNPILDSHQYVVGFEDVTEAELTNNANAQSMYAQFEPDGNQYLMIYSIVYFCRSTTALFYADQNFFNNGRTYRRIYTAG